jgi:hypothetical protein
VEKHQRGGGRGCGEIKRDEKEGSGKTHDFSIVLSEIPTMIDGAVLALAHGGAAKVMVQYDTPAEMIAIAAVGPALAYRMGDAHI